MWNFRIFGETRAAKVTSDGELVVAPIAYDSAVSVELGVDNQVYNLHSPFPQRRLVITGIFAFGDKQVNGSTNASVEIYEATSDEDAVVAKTIFDFEIGQNMSRSFNPLNIVVTEGRYINARTSDDDVHLTVTGHYIHCSDCG